MKLFSPIQTRITAKTLICHRISMPGLTACTACTSRTTSTGHPLCSLVHCDVEPSGSRDIACMVVALGNSVSDSKRPRDGEESTSEEEDMFDDETGGDEDM